MRITTIIFSVALSAALAWAVPEGAADAPTSSGDSGPQEAVTRTRTHTSDEEVPLSVTDLLTRDPRPSAVKQIAEQPISLTQLMSADASSDDLMDMLFKKENRLRSAHATLTKQNRRLPMEAMMLLSMAKIVLVVIMGLSKNGGLTGAATTGSAVVEATQNFFLDNPDLLQTLQSLIAILPGLLPVAFRSEDAALNATAIMRNTQATAISRLDGVAFGEIFFVQTKAKNEEGLPTTIVSGAIEGLQPGSHILRIHQAGDISAGCSRVGEQFKDLGGRTLTADDRGRAVLLLQDYDVPLTGSGNVMGRSIVITAGDGVTKTCGVIAQT